MQQREVRADEIEKYAPMVKRIALHLKARLPASVELDDLIQSGMLGLMDAIQHFESGHGAVFETYATIRIRGAMIDEMRQYNWAPRSVSQGNRQISEAVSRLSQRLGREPAEREIADELGVSLEKYRQMLLDSSTTQVIGIEDLGITDDVISADGDYQHDRLFEMLATSEFKASLVKAIMRLPEREQQVLSLYYDDELNLKEIGKVLDVSESRVSQIMSQSMARLRASLKDWRS
ncbi:MAG: RNA polymerase sigma factor FliA [Succinivibrionaceae bacterium]|nr:RNA polymerase sigma factor FliA [Succinivibrionaceae bacterium]